MDASNSQSSRGDQSSSQERVFDELFRILRPILDKITRPTVTSFQPDGYSRSSHRLFEVASFGVGVEVLIDEHGQWYRGVDFRNGALIVKPTPPDDLLQRFGCEDLLSGVVQTLDAVIERRQEILDGLVQRREQVHDLLAEQMKTLDKAAQS